MGKKQRSSPAAAQSPPARAGRPSSLLDTRVVYCGDNLEPLAKLPDACVDLLYVDPSFNELSAWSNEFGVAEHSP